MISLWILIAPIFKEWTKYADFIGDGQEKCEMGPPGEKSPPGFEKIVTVN